MNPIKKMISYFEYFLKVFSIGMLEHYFVLLGGGVRAETYKEHITKQLITKDS